MSDSSENSRSKSRHSKSPALSLDSCTARLQLSLPRLFQQVPVHGKTTGHRGSLCWNPPVLIYLQSSHSVWSAGHKGRLEITIERVTDPAERRPRRGSADARVLSFRKWPTARGCGAIYCERRGNRRSQGQKTGSSRKQFCEWALCKPLPFKMIWQSSCRL